MSGIKGNGSVTSLPPPQPKSPPELYGRRRELAKVQVLEREIGFLEEELKSIEGLQLASRSCKEVADFVTANADPLIPITKKISRSCGFWKWLCGGISCFKVSCICCCCCSCPSRPKMPSCGCKCDNCGNPFAGCCRMTECCSCLSSCWNSKCFEKSKCSTSCSSSNSCCCSVPKCRSCTTCSSSSCAGCCCTCYPDCLRFKNICSCCQKSCCYPCYFCY